MVLTLFIPKPIAVLPYPQYWYEPRDMTPVRQHVDGTGVDSMQSCGVKGSHSPEPPPVYLCRQPLFTPDKWVLWKPPGLEETELHTVDVVRLGSNRMSSQYSPTPETALMLFAPLPYPRSRNELWDITPATVGQHGDGTDIVNMCSSGVEGSCLLEPPPAHISGIKLDRKLLWKPLDMEKTEQHAIDVVKLKFMKQVPHTHLCPKRSPRCLAQSPLSNPGLIWLILDACWNRRSHGADCYNTWTQH